MCAHCALYCAALRSSRNFINSLCLIVGSFAVLFTDTKGERFCAAGQRLRRLQPSGPLPLPFNEHQTTRLCKCAVAVLGWGLRAALRYFLSFQVATEAAVRPPIRPSVGALCRCTIDFSAEAIFTLMRHEIVCHIIPMSRTACFCVVGVKRCTRVLCWGTGGKGSDASWQGDGRKEGRTPVLASGQQQQHSLR